MISPLLLSLLLVPSLVSGTSMVLNDVYSVSIAEELPIGAIVGNLKTFFESRGNATVGGQFKQIPMGRQPNLFQVDESSGDIRVASRVDRDALCRQRQTCIVELLAYLNNRIGLNVFIDVSDINDCAPAWPDGVIRLEFRDGDPAGRSVDILPARDADLGRNSSLRCTLDNRGAPFALHQDGNRLRLEASKTIDREERHFYNMTLRAVDGGEPPLSGSVQLQVSVADINDHTPQFAGSLFSPPRPVYEDEPIGSVILQLNATDKDSGAYGKVLFEFAKVASEDQDLARRHFLVQPDGRVVIKEKLDYDTMAKKYFIFEVIARDDAQNAENRKSSTATVSIGLNDRSDESPVIQVCFLPNSCNQSPLANQVKEAQPPGSAVALVLVRDLDAGDSVSCAVEAEPGPIQAKLQFPFALVATPGRGGGGGAPGQSAPTWIFDLIANRTLDRESEPRLCFRIACTDAVGRAAVKSCCVDVEDVNDSPPVASQSPINVWAPEGDTTMRPLKTRLLNYVRDADQGENARLTFLLDPGDTAAAGIVSVDIDTGLLTPRIVFDREQRAVYTIGVLVRDRGQPSLSASMNVLLHVSDVNDNAPVFVQPSYAFNVSENCLPRTTVGSVEASDADSAKSGNGRVEYRLARAEGSDRAADVGAFSIDRQSGAVRTVAKMDREAQAEYAFHVLAIDKPTVRGEARLTGTCLVRVLITDVNDNAPRLVTSPPLYPEVFHLRQREPGARVGRVRAEDADNIHADDASAGVEYELVNSAQLGHRFSVDRISGLVLIDKSLRNDVGREFQLRVRACDTLQPRRCSAANLYRVVMETDTFTVGSGGITDNADVGKRYSDNDIRSYPHAPSHIGFGVVGASETVIACLSAMLLLLGAAVVVIVCILVRRRGDYKWRCRSSGAAAATAADGVASAAGTATAAGASGDATSLSAAGQFELDAVSTKMLTYPPSYDRCVVGNDQDRAEQDFGTYGSNSIRLKSSNTALYTAHRRSTLGREGTRYFTASPAVGTRSQYQPLDAPMPRSPWQPMSSAEAPARLHIGGLRACSESDDSDGAAACGGAASTLPRNFRRRVDRLGAADGKPEKSSVYCRLARRGPLCPYTEASFV